MFVSVPRAALDEVQGPSPAIRVAAVTNKSRQLSALVPARDASLMANRTSASGSVTVMLLSPPQVSPAQPLC